MAFGKGRRRNGALPALTVMAVLILIAGTAHGEATVSDVRVVNSTAFYDSDSALDSSLDVASDGADTLVAVWRAWFVPALCNSYQEVVLMVRSDDAGVSWTHPVSLGEAKLPDYGPDVATDGQGTWIAVWADGTATNRDVYVVRSTDDGVTWSDPERLLLLSGLDEHVEVAAAGGGKWVVLWTSDWPVLGADQDIVLSRSNDDGATWSAPQAILPGMSGDNTHEYHAELTGDGSGTLVAAWTRYGGGQPVVIQVARSTDGGRTWSVPEDLRPSPEASYEGFPSVVGDGQGNWIVAWGSTTTLGGTIGADDDLFYSTSSDDGFSWSDPQLLNNNGATDVGVDGAASAGIDAWGNWVVSWTSDDDLGGTIGTDWDVLFAVSKDSGANWTDPQPVGQGATDSEWDGGGRVVRVANAGWRLVWSSRNPLGGIVRTDADVLTQALRIPFDPTCASDVDGDGFGSPGDLSCPLGEAEDCDDGDIWIWPEGPQICDGSNNDCLHPDWPALADNETDDDGDGRSECSAYDCDDGDPDVWGAPGEVRNLLLAEDVGGTILTWNPPLEPGGTQDGLSYEVLRATETTFYCSAADDGADVCLETDVYGEQVTDPADPDPGDRFFYQIRAVTCGDFRGPLGYRSSGSARTAPSCEF